jgi:hypothetical protein
MSIKRVGTRVFGWCLDGNHDRCPGTNVEGILCTCEKCKHKEKT